MKVGLQRDNMRKQKVQVAALRIIR